MNPAVKLTDDQFFELCQINRELRLERTAKGDIIVIAPAGGETSNVTEISADPELAGFTLDLRDIWEPNI